jgi:5,10-methylenetetrahydromethanopterin reductase
MTASRPKIGVMFLREYLPESIPNFACTAEQAGFDDLWFVEDAFYNGGISAAGVALAVTSHISVGIGIQPAAVRNVAYNAMDLATLARIYPGRFEIGLGHGLAEWIRQVGEFPSSQMGALGDATRALRQLLRGETVTVDTPDLHLDAVALEYPPATVPRVSLGVTGPKSLNLSGRVADGTILVEMTGPALVRHNRTLIAAGQEEAGRGSDPHQITVFAYWSQDADGATARDRLRPQLAGRIDRKALRELQPAGFADEAAAMLDQGSADVLARDMPDAWIDELAVAGSAADCLAAIGRLGDAGADRVTLVPAVSATIDQIAGWARDLFAAR